MKRPFSLSIGQLTFGSFLLRAGGDHHHLDGQRDRDPPSRFDLRRTAAAAERRRPRRGHRPPDERIAARGARLRHRSGRRIESRWARPPRPDRGPEEDPAGTCPRTAGHDRRRHRTARDLPQRHRADLDADRSPGRIDRGIAAVARHLQQGGRRQLRPRSRRALSETQSRIAAGLLAHNPSAAEQAAQSMRAHDDHRSGAAHRGQTITPMPSSRYRSGSGRSPISTRRCSAPKAG